MDGMSMISRGIRRGTMVGALLCVGLMSVMGGCNRSNQQLELAKQESAELREKNVELDTRLREKDTKIAELEGRLATTTASPQGGYAPEPRPDRPITRQPRNTGGSERFTVSGDVLFDSGQATLKAGAKKELDKVASTIKNKHAGASVRVEGYTDSDPVKKSKWGSNEALSEARAESVAKYLKSKGISNVTSTGMGSSNPKSTKALSRRVEIVVEN